MLLHVPGVLEAAEVERFCRRLQTARWGDGRITAGYQSAAVKQNLQALADDAVVAELGRELVARLERHPTFFAGALPRRIFPPLFNCYRENQAFGTHIDNAVRYDRGGAEAVPVRTDLAATLFLAAPADYDGGELVIEDSFGEHAVKLPAGDLVLYPASSLHRVTPVTCGARIAAFFWIQSLVRDDARRRVLFDLDVAIQSLTRRVPDAPELIRLTGVYHNLLRQWAET
ncbi:MAG TPA: Fe2+-dependent dioxygenase [Rhodanobacteraceae bacterium]|nr:Fe2+-dependent dioxygenase [Rhodanobacteraceae bacterium]